MLLCHTVEDCLHRILGLLDPVSVTMTTFVPELVPPTLLSRYQSSTDPVTDAVTKGYHSVVRWLVDQGYSLTNNAFRSAVDRGDVVMLEYLYGEGCETHKEACDVAAERQHFDALRWLLEIGCKWDECVEADVALSGDLNMLETLYTHFETYEGSIDQDDLYYRIAEKGHIHILEYYMNTVGLHDDYVKDAFYGAASGNRPEIIRWLVCDVGKDPPEDIADHACSGGQLEMVEWLVSEGHNPTSEAYPVAARWGRDHILEWLLEHGVVPDITLCEEAALRNRLDVLKWVRENGLPFDPNIVLGVTRSAEIVEWVRGIN